MGSQELLDQTFVRRVALCDEDLAEASDLEAASLDIHQMSVGDVGCVVWDAAIVLSQVLTRSEAFQDVTWCDTFVVELGSGTGLVGLAAARLGCEVVLTDLPECMELMQLNCAANKSKLRGSARAAVLAWGGDVAQFVESTCSRRHIDLVLMADVIYYDASIGPLLETLHALCTQNTQIVMCYEDRTTGNKVELKEQFFRRAKQHFLVEELPLEVAPEDYRCAEIHVVAMKLRDVAT
ncbi:protein N-lysine methyltransferase METTL21D-like [Sycon ciliatum]|uniref:protein N-lysine methyltransferase METTL21D-like n=1 Tax=Sycon ciliatum TaxID=27933 RepID=UPI0020AE2F85|eukprot:scpid62360/ scgid20785/ Methyltransferase-like protein 21D